MGCFKRCAIIGVRFVPISYLDVPMNCVTRVVFLYGGGCARVVVSRVVSSDAVSGGVTQSVWDGQIANLGFLIS